ncbi:hypothetical protein CW734_15890 [Planococcus sp. MB-3u-03]|nr:hypothetical protein CW734_15890 [Planococcus sp. MB-3u-03]PKG87539.1 hypothetical protein CXF91_16275 [Planococcus sp. Urea-3u-39]
MKLALSLPALPKNQVSQDRSVILKKAAVKAFLLKGNARICSHLPSDFKRTIKPFIKQKTACSPLITLDEKGNGRF